MQTMLRRVKLMNPFEIVQDLVTQDRMAPERQQAQPVELKVANRAARATPVCAACGSDDIICHATAQWSNEAQEWQLANTFNQPARCNTCNHDGNLVWLTLN
jgi:hypothetical protein